MAHVVNPQTMNRNAPVPNGCDSLSAAEASGADPCDVACDAMPALLLGDLSASDRRWVAEHTKQCGYCSRMLGGYQRIGSVLDRLNSSPPKVDPPHLACLPHPKTASWGVLESPLGRLFVAVSDDGVCEIDFDHGEEGETIERTLVRRGFRPRPNQTAIATVGDQLSEYFRGERGEFTVPLDLSGITPFTRAVLEATEHVPFGRLSTYRQIASAIGQPSATRAVGNALGRNPVPIVVPCHRVVRSEGSLGGYTGGLHIKEHLLKIEGVLLG